MKPLLLLLVFVVVVMAQSPPSPPLPAPCSEIELRKAMALALAAGAEAEAEARALRADDLVRQNADLNRQLETTRQNLVSEQKASTTLSVSYQRAQVFIVEQNASIELLTAERDALASKIANANNRWTCEVLKIGCIGER